MPDKPCAMRRICCCSYLGKLCHHHHRQYYMGSNRTLTALGPCDQIPSCGGTKEFAGYALSSLIERILMELGVRQCLNPYPTRLTPQGWISPNTTHTKITPTKPTAVGGTGIRDAHSLALPTDAKEKEKALKRYRKDHGIEYTVKKNPNW